MYYDVAKAVTKLALPRRPVIAALRDAVDWFRANNYIKVGVLHGNRA
jgi:dihydroflavonol-4-reductase